MSCACCVQTRAGEGVRTLDFDLGKASVTENPAKTDGDCHGQNGTSPYENGGTRENGVERGEPAHGIQCGTWKNELLRVVEAWPRLPEGTRRKLMKLAVPWFS
jgi:hypothetical protein